MISGHSVLALVPARKGSKGLPGKNMRPFCGRPLIEWTLERALQSDLVDRVLLSSDSSDMIEIAQRMGAAAPFVRPANLASDTATTLSVASHALAFMADLGEEFDYTILLEPTSPLREPGDIDAIIARLDSESNNFDAVVSVGRATQHPGILKRIHGQRLLPYGEDLAHVTRRQDHPAAWFPYGVGYACKTSVLLSEGTFYPRRTTWFAIKRHQELEIDDIYDFICAEAIMEHERSGR